MCNPGSFIEMAGAGLEAFGDMYKGQAEANQKLAQSTIYGINADIAETNAHILRSESEITEQGATLSLSKAALQETRMMRMGREVGAAETIDAVSRGLDPSKGTPLYLAARSAAELDADIGITRAHGQMEYADTVSRAASIMGQAAGAAGQARSARISQSSAVMASENALTMGKISAGVTMLKAAGKAVTQNAGMIASLAAI